MDHARPQPLFAPLTATEHHQVQRAAAAAGQSIEEFARAAILNAATDPFRDALEQAVDTVANRDQHDYAPA
ncbi:hypothetical protein ABZV52_29940 [Streptomyces sp. NPDC004735]|uniref:hypothetical protein n=1 Tax=Streptomyces TaxID=1883 RepID=UPI0033AB6346